MKSQSPIPVRAMRFELDESIPRAWLAGDPIASHVVNALSLVFPEGERFFIRSVKHYLDRIEDDPELMARVRGFFGQEGRHGHEHDRMNRILEAQGYEIESFLRFYRKLGYGTIERATPPHLRLASTVALEHLTAMLAEVALTTPILDDAHPVIRDLLKWHAAEEIEHKSVTFDVLAKVDPRLSTRVAGFAIGGAMLALFWTTALASLLAQEAAMKREAQPDRAAARRFRDQLPRVVHIARAAIAHYLRPDFHPDERDNSGLATQALSELGAPYAQAA